jgi:hypothetical protein
MVRTSLIAVAILLMLPAAQSADPPSTPAKAATKAKSKAPTGPPPRWARVRMDDDERIRVREYVLTPMHRIVERPQVNVDTGERTTVHETKIEFEPRESVCFVAIDDVIATTAGGKKIVPSELARLLDKDTAAMVTNDKNPVDRFYLATLKDETLVLGLPQAEYPSVGASPYGPALTGPPLGPVKASPGVSYPAPVYTPPDPRFSEPVLPASPRY